MKEFGTFSLYHFGTVFYNHLFLLQQFLIVTNSDMMINCSEAITQPFPDGLNWIYLNIYWVYELSGYIDIFIFPNSMPGNFTTVVGGMGLCVCLLGCGFCTHPICYLLLPVNRRVKNWSAGAACHSHPPVHGIVTFSIKTLVHIH